MELSEKTYRDLPLYKIELGDSPETGIDIIAITATPAIEEMGIAFANVQPKEIQHFSFNEDKGIILAPAMIPNLPMLRRDEDGYEYFVVFSPEVIEQLVERFNSSTRDHQFNFEHTDNIIESAFIKSNWIKESMEHDKSNAYGFKSPIGTWFVEAKINNVEAFAALKESFTTGFSIEGIFGLSLSSIVKQEIINPNKNESKMEYTKEEIALIAKFRAEQLALAEEASANPEDSEEIEAPASGATEEVIIEAAEDEEAEEAPASGSTEEVIIEAEEAEEEAEEEAAPAMDEAMVAEMIQAKYDELMAMIAELKSAVEGDKVKDEEPAGLLMSKIDSKISLVQKFRSNFK